jgi:hypothetical protein
VTRRQRLLRAGKPFPQRGQAPRLGEPLGCAAIPPPAASTSSRTVFVVGRFGFALAGAQRTPRRQRLHRGAQIGQVAGQATHPQLVLVLHGTGDRARPPRRRHRADRLLALGTPHRPAVTIQHTATDTAGQLVAIHRTQECPDRPQRGRLGISHLNPGADAHTRGPGGHHRITDPTERPLPSHTPHARSHHRQQRRVHR